MKILILGILSFTVLNSCSNLQAGQFVAEEKMKGMNYTGPGRGPFGEEPFSSMKSIGTNFVALVPEATLYQNSLEIRHRYSGDSTWYGESTEAVLEGIAQARKVGLQVMLKPHLEPGFDLSDWNRPKLDRRDSASRADYFKSRNEFLESVEMGIREMTSWRGNLMSKDEAGWEQIAEGYRQYILSYAVLADSMNVELFCIGTELKAMALEKPEYWRGLIREVRKIYQGPITYAANWDSYDQVSFWDELDYIGVDAYFPLGDHQIPSIEESVEEWKVYKEEIIEVQVRFNKPVIFTEWGYESEEYAGKTPWDSKNPVNNEVQVNLYEATFQSFWNEPWFQGVFVWRWSPTNEFGRGTYNFSPKGMPAEKVLERWFKTGK
ncbi:MAG: hypothetical protein RIM99_17085 [Cyclobacteriaceae bacterium]